MLQIFTLTIYIKPLINVVVFICILIAKPLVSNQAPFVLSLVVLSLQVPDAFFETFTNLFLYVGYCAFVDAEHALDPSLAEIIGVKTDNLLLAQPDSGEQALSLVDTLIRSGSVDVVVVDSVSPFF